MKKKTLLHTICFALLLCLPGCSEQEAPGYLAPVVTTGEAEVDGRSIATINGTISIPAGTKVADCGFIYSTVSTLPKEESTVITLTPDPSGTSYTTRLTGLTPGTTYYYCLYASSGYTEVRGDIKSFTTDMDGVPVFSEVTCTAHTESSLTVSARLLDNGGYNLLRQGFYYKLAEEGNTEAPNKNDMVINVDMEGDLLTATIDKLLPGREYAVCAYGLNQKGEGCSEPLYVSTSSATVPVLSATTAKDTLAASIVVEASLIDSGSGEVTEIGFCWSSENEQPTTEMLHEDCSDQLGNETISLEISGLKDNTTYYIRAYAVNKLGTGYGETFCYTPTNQLLVQTDEASNVDDTSATLSGEIISDGGNWLKAKGFFCSMQENPAETGTRYDSEAFGNKITVTLDDLEIGVTYYYCAFAESVTEMVYGEVKQFTTTITKPDFAAPFADFITATTATVTSYVENRVSLDHCGLEMSTTPLPEGKFGEGTTLIYDRNYDGKGVQCELEGLTPNTTYYIRAWGERGKTNECVGTINPATVNLDYYGFSETITFSTLPEVALPTVGATTTSDITENSATLTAEVTSDGGGEITEKGFCYSSTNNTPTEADTKTVSTVEGNAITATLSGLKANTTYYVRAYAANKEGISYGAVATFTTLDDVEPLNVTTVRAEVGTHSAILIGSASGGKDISKRGFIYGSDSTEEGLKINGTECTEVIIEGNYFGINATNLTPNTTYYFIAFAESNGERVYGEILSFTTEQEEWRDIVFGTIESTNITHESADLKVLIEDDGGHEIIEKGFCYSNTNNTPTEADSKVVSTTDGNAIAATLSGLKANTTYYVRAYAVNSKGISYGATGSFSTKDNRTVPVVETIGVSNIGETTATFSGNVASDGGSTVTSTGFFYGTTANPVSEGTRQEAVASGSTFSFNASGLTAGTHYYVCAYASNELGTSYGSVVEFTTSASIFLPTVGSTSVGSITATSASASAVISSDGGATVTERGFYYGTNNPPTEADTKVVSTATGNSITADLSGLSPNTRYYIRAFATNSQGTQVGAINVFTTADNRTAPSIGSITASNLTSATVDLLATIIDNGGADITEKGFCYTTTAGTTPTTADSKAVSTTEGDDISLTLTGLRAVTTYYIRAYAINGSKTGYSETITVTTPASNVPGIDDNISPDR